MQKENKRVIIVLSGIVLVFIGLVLYLAYFQVVKAETIVNNPYNSRLWVDESKYFRGKILDRNGTVLAESTEAEDGTIARQYYYGRLFSHVLGYTSTEYGKTGLESSYNNELLNISRNTPIDELKIKMIENSDGNNLMTTLDVTLQQFAMEKLDGHKGSIVLMNPKTGEVYAMVANPNFDPNQISEDWEQLITDSTAPLLNRSTQGLYTPGSVIKVITATALLEEQGQIDLNYHDEGKIEVEGYTINNFEFLSHGDINLKWALIHSSNTYFVEKAMEIGSEKMKAVMERYLFNKEIEFDIPVEVSQSPFEAGMSITDLAAASYGQGTTLVTPLNMAMVASAIANEGKMVKPILVSRIIKADGELLRDNVTRVLSTVTTPEVANELREYMTNVVENYSTAQIGSISSAGKTGTAETASGLSHAWYIGFAPAEDPKFAVAVVLEEDGTLGGTTAAPIGAAMLEQGYFTID
ncbi:MAG: penicillin-binding transpeptidase domain-containing protein [Tissierellia bacterium]|nr:penicillin-binding transpeptidase domain-containing protein [Tissierellia bacterium]